MVGGGDGKRKAATKDTFAKEGRGHGGARRHAGKPDAWDKETLADGSVVYREREKHWITDPIIRKPDMTDLQFEQRVKSAKRKRKKQVRA